MSENVVVVHEKKRASCLTVGCLSLVGLCLLFFATLFVSDFFDGREAAKQQKVIMERFETDRDEILREIAEAIDAQDFDLAYRIGERYSEIDDFEFQKKWATILTEMDKAETRKESEKLEATKQKFEENREEILADIEAAIDVGDFDSAYKIGEPYVSGYPKKPVIDDFAFEKAWAKIEAGRDAKFEARQDALADAILSRVKGGGSKTESPTVGDTDSSTDGDKGTVGSLVDGVKFIVNEVNKAEEQRNQSFQKDRDKIISSISAAIEEGDYDSAFRLANPYSGVDDFEFRQLWAKISAHRQTENQ